MQRDLTDMTSPHRRRAVGVLSVAIVALGLVQAGMWTSSAWGQGDGAAGGAPAGGGAAPAPAGGAGAAGAAPAPGGGAPAANAPAGGAPAAPAAESRHGESYFMWVCRSSGLIGLFIVLLSMYFVATVIQLFIQFRIDVLSPPAIVAECENLLGQRDFQEMYNLLVNDDSYFSTILATGIAELRVGLHEARDAMERQADSLTVDMEKKTSILAVLGTLGPMIGLLGTLKGMIGAFSVIAMGAEKMDASKVAEQISEGLLLTFEGVLLSIPAIYFFAFFRNRIAAYTVSTQLKADDFLRRMGRMAKSKGPAAAAGHAAV